MNADGLQAKALWLFIDPLWGVSFFIVVNWIVSLEPGWRQSGHIPPLVQSLAALGFFSYSLYLTHELLVIYFDQGVAQHLGLGANAARLLSILVLAPLSVVFARLFFQFCELPFIPTGRAAVVAITSGPLEVAEAEPA